MDDRLLVVVTPNRVAVLFLVRNGVIEQRKDLFEVVQVGVHNFNHRNELILLCSLSCLCALVATSHLIYQPPSHQDTTAHQIFFLLP